MEVVASDTKILIDLSAGKLHGRLLEELLYGPTVRQTHAFGLTHGDCLIDRIAGYRGENLIERVVKQIPDCLLGLETARVDIAFGIDGDLRAAEFRLEKIQTTRPSITEVIGEGRSR